MNISLWQLSVNGESIKNLILVAYVRQGHSETESVRIVISICVGIEKTLSVTRALVFLEIFCTECKCLLVAEASYNRKDKELIKSSQRILSLWPIRTVYVYLADVCITCHIYLRHESEIRRHF